MVELHWEADRLIIRPVGRYVLLAVKRRIVVQREQMRMTSLRSRAGLLHGWRALVLPGIHLPGRLHAGSFYTRRGWEFWLTGRAGRVVEIELTGHRYRRLVLQLENPASSVRKLEAFRLQLA